MNLTRGEIVHELWFERNVSLQCSTSHAEHVLEQVAHIPGWFPSVELGLALHEGPSVFWTTANLEKINRANREALEGKPKRGRPRKPVQRTTARQYHARVRRLMHRMASAA